MWSKLTEEHQVIGLMLFLGLIIGLIFIYLVPPWQHYDEPTHFEYAWLIANRQGIPEKGEYDLTMRREVASSMIERGFFNDLGFKPNLISITEPIWIGISQTGSNPIYYWLAAIPLRALRTTDVTFQLLVLRFVSLTFFLITIVAAYGIAVELTPNKHPLRWLLPITILLLPGFVDLLTAVNDDVGATAFFSLFLWSGIILINRGFRWLRFVFFVLLGLICFYTKNTVMIAVPLVLIPLLFSIIHKENRRYFWIALTGILILLVASLFTWGDPLNWYKRSSPESAVRAIHEAAPAGDQVFKFSLTPDYFKVQLEQILTGTQNDPTTYTIGAWIWADQAAIVQTPILRRGGDFIVGEIEVNEEPKFFSVSGEIKESGTTSRIILSPFNHPPDEPIIVYYDGLLVVEGAWPNDSIPEFNNESGTIGVWGSKEFSNLVRNPSAENGTLRLRTWVETIYTDRFPGNPAIILGLILDPISLSTYYTAAVKSLLQTFWAKFGWAHVVLIGYRPYTFLGLFTLSGLIGAIAAFWRKCKEIRWDVFLFFGLALLVVWGAAILRGITSVLDGTIFLPVARYAYPVIIPTMLILNIGWLEIIGWFERYSRISQKVLLAILLFLFVILDILSIFSIYRFYNQ